MMLFDSGSLFKPDLSRRDIAIMVRVLALGADEQEAINELYAGYEAALAIEGGAVRSYCASGPKSVGG